jgi:SAM-dependent methyltransferase
MSSIADAYLSLGPLETRIATHVRYSEAATDIEADVRDEARIGPDDALLDVGPGTGSFLRRLREQWSHTGRLAAVDLSAAAVAAAGGVAGVEAKLGDATDLPFADAQFDVVTARHMLYHVPDQAAAVRAARRVLRPGGRFAATVNIAGTTPLINAVLRDVLADHGSSEGPRGDDLLNSDSLADVLRAGFGGEVRTLRRDSALVFHEPEPIIAYCLTMLPLSGVGEDDPRFGELGQAVVEIVRTRFAGLGGVWRDPKGFVVCTAVKSGNAAES